MNVIAVQAQNLHKSYLLGATAVGALRGVDLTIQRGEFVAFMGPSGCGKTTLLNLIGAIDTPSRGTLCVDDVALEKLSEDQLADLRRDRIGVVFQFYNLLPTLSARENVELPMQFKGADRRERRERSMLLLERVGLKDRADHKPAELSGGEQQRVSIARALANQPALVLLDEPTGDLDSVTGQGIMSLLRDLNQREKVTLLVATHDSHGGRSQLSHYQAPRWVCGKRFPRLMNAWLLYVLRNLGRRRARTIVGALGIFLTIGLLTAIQIGLDSVSMSYIDLVALQAGKADIIVSRPGGDLLNAQSFDPAEVRSRLERNPHLRGLSPRLLGIVQVSLRGEEHYAVVIGIDPQRERELDISGVVPEPSLGAQTCAISKPLAEKLKAKAGTRLSVRSPSTFSELNLPVETVLDRQLLLPQQIRDYVVVNLAVAREILGEPTRVHLLAGAFRNPRSYYDARDLHGSVLRLKDAGAAIAADLGMEFDVRLPKAAAITAFQDFTSPLRAVFGVFALLALTITGLLIYSLISMSVEERIREYAILRTLGAKRRDIFRLVLSESVLLCCFGVAPGVFAGAVFAKMIVALVGLAMGAKAAVITLEISPATLWLTLAGGVLLSIGSALLPALRATRWRIVDALDPLRRGQIPLRQLSEGQVNRPLVLAGLVLSALSVVVFFVLPSALLSGNPSLIGTVVLCLLVSILLGFTLAMVGVLPFLQRIILFFLGGSFGPIAELVGRNLERHRRRHTTTALLFTLSVALVIFIASLVALCSRTALALVEHTHGADLRIHSAHSSESLKADLARLEGVSRRLRGQVSPQPL